jgi:AcrR family transcriptional regulator
MRQVPAKLASKLYGAADLIAERGIADAKVDEIAEAAGIPVATLYYYFNGKEEILAFLLHDLLESIAGAVLLAIGQPGTALERLRSAVETQMRVMLENPAACRALVGDLGRATRLPELAAAIETAFHQPLERLLTEGIEDGSLRPLPDVNNAALSIFGAVTVAGLTGAVAEPDQTAEFIEQTAAAVMDLLVEGLRPRS